MTETETLRARLHEHFHVGDPGDYACGGVITECSLYPAVIAPMQALVATWLLDLAEQAPVHDTDRTVMRYLAGWALA